MADKNSIPPLSPVRFKTASNPMPNVNVDPPLTPGLAVALRYLENTGSPKVVAKGRGLMAERIIQKATEHGVFVHQNRELLSILSSVELDKEIPQSLYQVVAELLVWVHENTIPEA